MYKKQKKQGSCSYFLGKKPLGKKELPFEGNVRAGSGMGFNEMKNQKT